MKLKQTELAPLDRQQLTSLLYHPGFTVLKHLMEQRVSAATVEMLGVAPDDPDREKKIATLQAVAYAQNAFCADLIKDVQYQVMLDTTPDGVEPEEDEHEKLIRKAMMQAGYLKQ